MAFDSLEFGLFFAITLALAALPWPWTFKKIILLVASYFFYAAWNPPYVLLLMLAAVVDFALAHLLSRIERQRYRQLVLAGSLTLNLGLLAFFKYSAFFVENLNLLLWGTGLIVRPIKSPDLLLPLGISFYTFETVSYLFDVYRRRIEPTRSFLDYALFLTFFPHLVAGPIVRANDFLPQLETPRRPARVDLGWGSFLMLLGLFEKIVLADFVLAPVADRVFGAPDVVRWSDAWLGTIAFAGQIFFDFSGYSTVGIGAALCFGFKLKRNFHFPYAAVGLSDFWRRWHISLSSWLRDYLYIPLGGNRDGTANTCGNLMVTMLLGGFWHGASWNFLIWGGLHGVFLTVERGLRWAVGEAAWCQARWARWLGASVTFLVVCVAWVYFRSTNLEHAARLLGSMSGFSSSEPMLSLLSNADCYCVLGCMGAVLICQWLLRDTTLDELAARASWYSLATLAVVMAVVIVLAPDDNRAFIYFQF